MTENNNQKVPMNEEQLNQWQRECLANAQKFLADKGVIPVSILEKECRILPPLCAIWKIKGNDANTYWVITGRLPTDAVQVGAAESARDVLRHFSFQWQLKADNIMANKPVDQTQVDFANLLVNRAHGIYELFENEQLWANVAS
ncbi:DUF4826 family protein [Pseudoalteromonas phenolica]|uniref:DUF4826 domain-containing protein n=1 Tax=Pseudoalteromonas phenolica TaxID=161398 RepID=A0A0S2K1Z2_9GAMM|nr:DUF4826 family protein [Pseudoalteromonas phenolica]ALO41986.1 hypothetical protein PP2015_1482 [Pseudoalteromonas phenolica]MBE0353452.1 hypothetical protein [Pseudoalteromonas phenolica O-BC30]RXE99537.1 DUF4826 family protein [Pseudoalteromonas phenolica O-BC30]TMO55277.1 DUF4826 domain-containing protein [Pseudoalteromonas phenolica]